MLRHSGSWLLAAVVAAACLIGPARAQEKRWDPKESVVGGIEVYEARFDDTLLDVARRFGMGIEEMKLANPGVDLWLPGEGTAIRLPARFVLPSGPRRGIVINVPEMRIYYYPKNGGPVQTWPIGIGRLEYETPLGKTSVVRKKVGPAWYPTDTIREEYAARGEPLPRVVLPGPENPLGSHAIYLGLPTYLIHGTNRPYSIGMRVSFGCVRLYPEDIVELYDLVAPGTPVSLVDQRVKAGWLGDELYLEVHPNPDLPAEEARPSMTDAVRAIIKATPEDQQPPVDWKLVETALADANGVPVVVGNRMTGPDLARTRRGEAPRVPSPPS
ncbi:MAG: L,D-transpeptidase family protein [Immundisolibacterales bacterium]|nr:L,D-transpeptidase family protein [Immundisolibacterales bacterium]